MKKIEDNLFGLLIVLILIGVLVITLLIVQSNKYEDELNKLKQDNLKKKYEIKELNNQLTDQINAIDYLLENSSDCKYFIEQTEDGFLIDGRLYKESEE